MPSHEPHSVLIGREHELGLLQLLVRRKPALVQVEGEAGVGKSRLVRELVDTLGGDVPSVLIGYCQQLREPFVLGAVLEALRRASGRLAQCADLNPVTSALRTAVPELADVLPAPATGTADPEFDRHLLFRAIREVLAALGPVLLVIEDLHWADDGTLQLLRFLMADPPPELAVVVTYRREDVAGGMPLGTAYRPGAGVTAELVQLQPLGVAQVRRLAAAILRTDNVSAAFAAELHEHTAGLPFVVEEVLRSMSDKMVAESGDSTVTRRLTEQGEVPVLLRESVAERLAALSPEAGRLVRAAAVFTIPAPVELLGEVARLSGDTLSAAVDEALACSILHDPGDGTCAFRHTLARQAVYSTVSAMERRELHQRAVRLLSALDPLPLVQLAEHSRLANRRADWLNYGEAAADQALAVSDATTATPLLQRLLAEPTLTGADVDRLGVKLGEASLLGLYTRGSAVLLKRLLVDPRLSSSARGEVRMQLGLLLSRQSDALAEGRAQLELAADELAGRAEMSAKCMSALAQPFTGDTPLSLVAPWMRKADAFIDECQDPELRIFLMANVVGSMVAIGDPDMHDRLATMPTLARTLGEQRQVARAHSNLADSLTIIGRFDTAREFLRFGTRAAEESGALYVLSTARSTAIRLDWFTGAWDGLAARAESLLVEYRELMAVATELNLVLGLLALARGEWAAAGGYLADTGVRTPQNAIAPIALGGSAGLVRLALRNDDAVLAVVEADAGMALLRRKEVWAWAGEFAPAAVDAYLAAGRVHDAQDVLHSLTQGITGVVAPMATAALHTCRGAIAEYLGKPAAEHHAAAARAYDDLGAPYLAATAWERTEAHRLAKGDTNASDALSRCAERYEDLGATHDAARCRHLLRTLGIVTPSRQGRRGYGNTLSPREREVARLLAAGHTNNQIAEILFLSPRTVEQHTSRVLRKLKVVSRRDIRASDLP
ncbi:helix-turn-helix transcriptional regulator [Actinokineospora globicatena]|uniref:helix-turn-helix transcriptional regulator n=1 Tax=Actinokineospora globicatena TaxID=103729 RepID=UPI0020A3172A|nr:LuxR family transcriptional regulator [Actinokineospora globicatena]MCP2305921.1 putative ATPase [Actinokineospora globicatena]GLW80211.1 LuxR family transcriptional regulator [Actinokineospora globicatena]GLW87040.1 LuxR family transcriptional regulator [Actinokineospora globicatena]